MGPSRRAVLGGLGTGLAASLAGCGLLSGGQSRTAWTYDDPQDVHVPAGDYLHVYRRSISPSQASYLWVLDAKTGEIADEVGGFRTAAKFAGDGTRSYHAGNAFLYGRNPDGSQAWVQSLSDLPEDRTIEGEVVDFALADGTIFTLRYPNRVTTFDAASGERQNLTTNDAWESLVDLIANAMVGGDETGFVVVHTERGENENGAIFGYDDRARKQWSTSVPWRMDEALDGGLVTNEHAIVVVGQETVHVHSRSGEHRWSKTVTSLTGGDVGLIGDQVLVQKPAGPLTAYDVAGGERWTFSPETAGWATMGLASDRIYASTVEDTYALTTDGKQRWRAKGVGGGLAVGEEYVYAIGDETLVALERE